MTACAIVAIPVLVALNRGSYDDGHVTAIAMVAAGHLPRPFDCDECFQPKLYYIVAGSLVRLLFIDPANATGDRIIGQVVSGAAGLVTLWLGWRMLVEAEFAPRVRLMAFALYACNPTVLVMFVQATNDAFAILFGSLTVLLMFRLARTPYALPLDRRTVLLLSLACIGVSVSKASGLALTGAVAFLLLWRAVTAGRAWRANVVALAIFAVPYLLTAPILGGYAQNALRVGTPFGIGIATSPPPGIFVDRPTGQIGALGRAGILSIAGGYFTLKPWELFEVPWHRTDPDDLGSARTSLWTQVFARSHFVFFEQWPLQWFRENLTVVILGRAIFVVGWITTAFALTGFGAAAVAVLRRRRGMVWPGFWSEDGAAITLMSSLVAALILFSYAYRNEGAMKPMYMYPAILCAVWAFARGFNVVRTRIPPLRAASFDAAAGGAVVAVCALYVAQLAELVETIVLNGL